MIVYFNYHFIVLKQVIRQTMHLIDGGKSIYSNNNNVPNNTNYLVSN